MSGSARRIEDESEIDFASRLLSGRQNKTPRPATEHMFSHPRRIYKFIPERVWINGDDTIEKDFIDIRIEISNEILKK